MTRHNTRTTHNINTTPLQRTFSRKLYHSKRSKHLPQLQATTLPTVLNTIQRAAGFEIETSIPIDKYREKLTSKDLGDLKTGGDPRINIQNMHSTKYGKKFTVKGVAIHADTGGDPIIEAHRNGWTLTPYIIEFVTPKTLLNRNDGMNFFTTLIDLKKTITGITSGMTRRGEWNGYGIGPVHPNTLTLDAAFKGSFQVNVDLPIAKTLDAHTNLTTHDPKQPHKGSLMKLSEMSTLVGLASEAVDNVANAIDQLVKGMMPKREKTITGYDYKKHKHSKLKRYITDEVLNTLYLYSYNIISARTIYVHEGTLKNIYDIMLKTIGYLYTNALHHTTNNILESNDFKKILKTLDLILIKSSIIINNKYYNINQRQREKHESKMTDEHTLYTPLDKKRPHSVIQGRKTLVHELRYLDAVPLSFPEWQNFILYWIEYARYLEYPKK